MYVFFLPHHRASPYVTGINPAPAILLISSIFSGIGAPPAIKSVGGRLYGFSPFFSIESTIMLSRWIIEFFTVETPRASYFFSLVCMSYFTDQ